jgi:hypothetical protein
MKKKIALLFTVIIAIHFACCTIYAAGFFQSASLKSNTFKGFTSNEYMKFESIDGFEVGADDGDTGSLHYISFSTHHSFILQYKTGPLHLQNDHITLCPIYISNHVLLI